MKLSNMQTEKISNSEKPHSLELANLLEDTDNQDLIHERLGEMLKAIENDLGVRFVSKVGEIYRGMQKDNCLVRTERLSRVLETMELDSPLRISDENERHYANAVIPNEEGIKIALSEGQAPGPVRIMVGFGKTIIGFKTDHVSVEEVEFEDSEIRDPVQRKFLCRHVTGELKKDDIRYMVIRIPYHFMREEDLHDHERAKKPKFVFRGVEFPK